MRYLVPPEFAKRFQLLGLYDPALRPAAIQGMRKYPVPLLSTFNGPSFLLHAVEMLHALGASAADVRLLPMIGRALDPEVLPYYGMCNIENQESVNVAKLRARLSVNVREDSRLCRLFPLVMIGLAPRELAIRWAREATSPYDGYAQLCAINFERGPFANEPDRKRGWYTRYALLMMEEEQKRKSEESREDDDPENTGWSNAESPAERLTRLLCVAYPELRRSATRLELPVSRVLSPGHGRRTGRRYGPFEERDNPFFGTGFDRVVANDEPEIEAQEIVDVFLTYAMLAIANVDMIGGLAYELQIEPPGRQTDLIIRRHARGREPETVVSGSSGFDEQFLDNIPGPAEVLAWLNAYPHRPLYPVSYEDRAERQESEAGSDQVGEKRPPARVDVFAPFPYPDEDYERASLLWTDKDPAILAVHNEIVEEYSKRIARQREAAQESRTEKEARELRERELGIDPVKHPDEPISTDEMLLFARRHLPEYVPCPPRQFCVTGGLNLEGLLLLLIRTWMGLEKRQPSADTSARAGEESGPFLGVWPREWALFTPAQQAILCALLLQRRQALDQCALFLSAARLLVDQNVEMRLERFRQEPVRLGKPLAQPSRTLTLNGKVGLHAPTLELRIPMDRTQDPEAELAESRLQILAMLFKPVHIPLKIIWSVNRAVLTSDFGGHSIYLRHEGRPDADRMPAARLEKA